MAKTQRPVVMDKLSSSEIRMWMGYQGWEKSNFFRPMHRVIGFNANLFLTYVNKIMALFQ